MKTPQTPECGWIVRLTRLPLAGAIGLCMVAASWSSCARAEAVDSELILLVDIVQPELSNSNFNRLLDDYADTFTSTQILNSIQSGQTGRIAVSMMLYGGANTQVVGVPWMIISNATEALSFANLVRNVTRPTTYAYSNPATAIAAAVNTFGTETGASGNGFESAVQVIEIATAGIPSNSMAAAAASSSANALSSGVDIINTLALGTFASSIESFYAANVIGSTIPGVPATSNSSPLNGTLGNTINTLITGTVQTGASTSISSVPEPTTLAALLPATLLLMIRRRR
jgi:hypothetical protein